MLHNFTGFFQEKKISETTADLDFQVYFALNDIVLINMFHWGITETRRDNQVVEGTISSKGFSFPGATNIGFRVPRVFRHLMQSYIYTRRLIIVDIYFLLFRGK